MKKQDVRYGIEFPNDQTDGSLFIRTDLPGNMIFQYIKKIDSYVQIEAIGIDSYVEIFGGKEEKQLLGKWVKAFYSEESKIDLISDYVPKFYKLNNMTGLGPFGSDVTIHAYGLLDDVFFIFEGTDPQKYIESGNYWNGPGSYPEGKIFWTEYTDRYEYIHQDLGVIPAGTIFSINLVDTVMGGAVFVGTITIESKDQYIDFSPYKTSEYNNKIFMLRTIKISDLSYTEEIFKWNELPNTLEMQDGYEYELYIIIRTLY